MLKMMLKLVLAAWSPIGLDLRLLASPIRPTSVDGAEETSPANMGLLIVEATLPLDPILGCIPLAFPPNRRRMGPKIIIQPIIIEPRSQVYVFWVCGTGWHGPRLLLSNVDLHKESSEGALPEIELLDNCDEQALAKIAERLIELFNQTIESLSGQKSTEQIHQQIKGCQAHRDQIAKALIEDQKARA